MTPFFAIMLAAVTFEELICTPPVSLTLQAAGVGKALCHSRSSCACHRSPASNSSARTRRPASKMLGKRRLGSPPFARRSSRAKTLDSRGKRKRREARRTPPDSNVAPRSFERFSVFFRRRQIWRSGRAGTGFRERPCQLPPRHRLDLHGTRTTHSERPTQAEDSSCPKRRG